ncbi:SpoIIE family protein phosphatase [Lachnoclostridium edouardi]|uniref:SpoIIE family protein phosphatase n=1 Tax=Lachnoclostridium edouardi TaxID=1926283 RepID=UPI000C7BF10B|nr:SpoIIE family protein phosphatase [Lachnoclostridium edouardi]
MLRIKTDQKNLADVNIYTAKKLNSLASSLTQLAKSCDDETGKGRSLTKEDGEAALKTAAVMVCGECSRCSVYNDSVNGDSYFLYYLLRAFEQMGMVSEGDMPLLFQESCPKKEEYIRQLNKSLGRATMNLAWKNRFLESRDALIVQFRELAVILEEFSHQMELAEDITASKEGAIRRIFKQNRLNVSSVLVLEYEGKQKEVFLTVKSGNGRCMTSREAAELVGQAMGEGRWSVSKDSKTIINRQYAVFRFVEEGRYRLAYGAACAVKEGEEVSGDNYSFASHIPGQVMISLSDGMGSGVHACQDSQKVVELTQQLLEAGFSARAALKMVNTVLLLTGAEEHPATLDLACVDLHSGVLEMMKLGAAATFVISQDGVEAIEAGEVPAGIISPVEPVLLSKKLWDENWIVMVSDGVLDGLPGEDKEGILKEYLSDMEETTPQELAEEILEFVISYSDGVRDDMTVLTARVWKRK